MNETSERNVFFKKNIYFLVLDLPTKEHAKQLTKNQQFQVYLKTLTDDGLSLNIVVHFSSKKVSDLREYRSLVSTINPKLNLYLDERNKYDFLLISLDILKQGLFNRISFLDRLDWNPYMNCNSNCMKSTLMFIRL